MTISAERPVQNDAVPIERQNPELSIDVEWPRIAAHVREAPSEPGFRPAPCVSIQAQPPDVCPREPFHVEPEASPTRPTVCRPEAASQEAWPYPAAHPETVVASRRPGNSSPARLAPFRGSRLSGMWSCDPLQTRLPGPQTRRWHPATPSYQAVFQGQPRQGVIISNIIDIYHLLCYI